MTDRRITIPENGLTKAQEIEIIKNFVAALPQDSYLNMMLTGFPEYAKQQIENDFGMNPLTTINQQADAIGKANAELRQQSEAHRYEVEQLTRERENFKKAAEEWQTSYVENEKLLNEAQDQRREDRSTIAQLEGKALADKIVIRELKAMLFDYMTTFGKIVGAGHEHTETGHTEF